MATVKEEFELLKAKILSGKENEVIHVVFVDQDRKRKLTNRGPKPQTKFVLDCSSPDAFRDLFTEWDRILLELKNKTMAVDFVIHCLREGTAEKMREWRKEGELGGPPKAEIPAWLKES